MVKVELHSHTLLVHFEDITLSKTFYSREAALCYYFYCCEVLDSEGLLSEESVISR